MAKKRTASRETARMERKRALAAAQAQQFEDELSGHELNLARLQALPAAQRDEGWQSQVDAAQAAIDTLDRAIETTLDEAEAPAK
jgi:hypothetical protein